MRIWHKEYPPETKTEDISNQLREKVFEDIFKNTFNNYFPTFEDQIAYYASELKRLGYIKEGE